MVAAHPDDEVIGAGIRLGHVHAVTVLHVTDGAPRDDRDARAAGCSGRAAYARLRRRELRSALERAGLPAVRLRRLGVVDGEAALAMAPLAVRLAGLLRRQRPQVVVTHPYEGGHPDHDAAAFAVHCACKLLRRDGDSPPCLIEMTSYHAIDGVLRTGAFLPGGDDGVSVPLTAPDAERKRRMLACFASQRRTLALFDVSAERFRLAPAYDFTWPPHDGAPYYEMFRWGPTAHEWRRLASRAQSSLGLADSAASPF